MKSVEEALERIKMSHYTAIAVMGCERDYETEEAIKIVEKALLEQKELPEPFKTFAQIGIINPTKYLKWEDLDFIYGEAKKLVVSLGDEILEIRYWSDFDFFNNQREVVEICNINTKSRICKIYDRNKQFFNNLHLVMVE